MKIRLIKEIPQNDASSPVPVSPGSPETPASPFKRTKKSWDEEFAKLDPDAKVTPNTEKDSEEN